MYYISLGIYQGNADAKHQTTKLTFFFARPKPLFQPW